MRTVVLHYHLFKNAGSSLDAAFQRAFPGRWVTREFGETQTDRAAHLDEVRAWIELEHDALVFSSHTALLPAPEVPDTDVLPVIFVRHPLDRIASAYSFEHTQVDTGFGATLAHHTSLAGYVSTRLSIPGDRQCRNFHTARFASTYDDSRPELERALAAADALPFVGIVEEYDESLSRLGSLLTARGVSATELVPLHRNASTRQGRSLDEKLARLREELGDEVFEQLEQANADDLALYAHVTGRAVAVEPVAVASDAKPASAAKPRPTATVLGVDDEHLIVTGRPDVMKRAELEVDGLRFPFQPVGDRTDLLRGVNLLMLNRGAATWELASGEGSLSTLDNPAWRVERSLPQMLAVTGDGTAVARHSDPVLGGATPVRPGRSYELSGRFALHGANAELRAVVLDDAGNELLARTHTLSPAFHGGTELTDYEWAKLRVSTPPGAASIRVEIAHLGRSDDAGPRPTSFVLFFWMGLTQPGAKMHGLDTGGARQLLDPEGPRVFRAPLDIQLTGHLDQVRVVLGDEQHRELATFALPDVSSAQVVIRRLNANLLVARFTGYHGVAHAFIDGQHAATKNVKAGTDVGVGFRLPPRFWDGKVHEIEVRDATRLRVLARSTEALPWQRVPWPAMEEIGLPLPHHLSPQAESRYRALSDSLAAAVANPGHADLLQLARAHAAVAAGPYQDKEYLPLEFPAVADPTVTVIVPVHNAFAMTYHCLASLLVAANRTSFDVVVVDDGSSDETLGLAAIAPGVTLVRHDEAKGFVGACTAGAAAARGRYLVLLNNDTEPTSGWLDELVDAFERHDRVGMAGSRLLYPHGRLQEAGGIVWETGDPINYGRMANPREPRFGYARQADYLSGAALMVSRSVWDEVGGLSQEYAPAYFEDTDLAFKVRDAGYTTWYVPTSVVYHFEGISNGTDVTSESGLKRFQEINRPKFKAKWAEAFVGNGSPSDDPDLVKDRGVIGRVLFVDYRQPRPDQDAGSYAAIQEIKLVQALGYKVTFAGLDMRYTGRYTDELNRQGVETVFSPFHASVEQFLADRGQEFDAVFITRYAVARKVLGAVRKYAPQARILFNNADLHFLRKMREASLPGSEVDWDEVRAVREVELEVMREADLVLSYNEVEHAVIQSHNLGETQVATCPWVVETRPADQVPGFDERHGVAFLGGYRHVPNVEAVEFFVRDVLPALREAMPDVELYLYGSAMPDSFRALADDRLHPVGFVDTVDQVHNQHRVFIAPLLSGAGIKGKVIGAVADGIPTVLSPIAAEGTGLRDGHDALIPTDVAGWVEAITTLHGDREAWERISRNGRELTTSRYSFAAGQVLMRQAFEQAGLRVR